MNTHDRVRFAPAPTGFMHLGNVRTALMNFLFARKKNGSFVLRVEDTDPQRLIDKGAVRIQDDLHWLKLTYNEGPGIGGPFAPYFQSERTDIYNQFLQTLVTKNKVYRCFCTTEELDKKRARQIALKQPPRYDRTCAKLTPETIEQNLAQNKPFIWRFHVPPHNVVIKDLARTEVHFDLKNFSDFPLTRTDGSFTFIFANCVDDITMEITCVIRGEDHISNSALQAALYEAFDVPLPIFWHLPMICNAQGKKLSKRDFGFSLGDLRNAGYLPEAINNYLVIIGGSFEKEIMSLEEIINNVAIESLASTSHIRYDLEKLRWLNHKWLSAMPIEEIAKRCRPFLEDAFEEITKLSEIELAALLKPVHTDLVTLADSVTLLQFYFKQPEIDKALITEADSRVNAIITDVMKTHADKPAEEIIKEIQLTAKAQGIQTGVVFGVIRLALTGAKSGMQMKELLELLPQQEVKKRLNAFALGAS